MVSDNQALVEAGKLVDGSIPPAKKSKSKKQRINCNSIKFTAMICMNFLFFLAEIIVGYYTNSAVLVADAFHMLADMAGHFVALFFNRQKASRVEITKRIDTLGGYTNGVILMTLCLTIFLKAIHRIIVPEPVEKPNLVLITGFGGLLINIIGCIMFSDRDEDDMNTKAAFFHILCDLAGSIIVMVSTGVSMFLPPEHFIVPRIDPIASMSMAMLLGSVTYFTVVSKSGQELFKILHDNPNSIP